MTLQLIPFDENTTREVTKCGSKGKLQYDIKPAKHIRDIVQKLAKKWCNGRVLHLSNERDRTMIWDAASPDTIKDIWLTCGKPTGPLRLHYSLGMRPSSTPVSSLKPGPGNGFRGRKKTFPVSASLDRRAGDHGLHFPFDTDHRLLTAHCAAEDPRSPRKRQRSNASIAPSAHAFVADEAPEGVPMLSQESFACTVSAQRCTAPNTSTVCPCSQCLRTIAATMHQAAEHHHVMTGVYEAAGSAAAAAVLVQHPRRAFGHIFGDGVGLPVAEQHSAMMEIAMRGSNPSISSPLRSQLLQSQRRSPLPPPPRSPPPPSPAPPPNHLLMPSPAAPPNVLSMSSPTGPPPQSPPPPPKSPQLPCSPPTKALALQAALSPQPVAPEHGRFYLDQSSAGLVEEHEEDALIHVIQGDVSEGASLPVIDGSLNSFDASDFYGGAPGFSAVRFLDGRLCIVSVCPSS